jgi:hypothetical protein
MDESQSSVCVLAGRSSASFEHALQVGRDLARTRGCALVAVVPAPRVISSDRAHAYGTRADAVLHGDDMSAASIATIAARVAPEARVVSEGEIKRHGLGDATIVVAGSLRRIFESLEQRLARELTAAGCELIFLPETGHPA